MYICQITGKQSKPGEGLNKIVIATRERTYTKWVRNEETNKWEEVFVAKGTEIVKEVNASTEGMATWNAWENDERWLFIKNYYPELVKTAEEAQEAAKREPQPTDNLPVAIVG